jgi:hypothetical protein
MFLKCDPYRVWCSIFYSKLVNCILLRSFFVFVKGRGTCGSGEKIWIDFWKSPRFSLTSPLSQEREKSSRPAFTMCGEPCPVIKMRQLLSERESQSAMIICRVCARRFFQFPVMFTNNKKWRSTSWLTMFNSLFNFPTFLLFSPFKLVRSNTWVQWKHLTPERSIDLCLQTFPKLILLLVPKITTHSLYRECIANLKLPIDAFYRESRSGVNIAKRNI